MIRYALETGEINDILSRVNALFNLRITFFDVNDTELNKFDIKPHSDYCARRRCSEDFELKCRDCDRSHLIEAKETSLPQIYRCHSGLYEGVIPLYNENRYLGSLVFGQVRPPGFIPEDLASEDRESFESLPEFTRQKMNHLAGLLGRLSEYMVIKEFIRYRNSGWAERLETYIRENLSEKITITDLADHVGKSLSFITHVFREEFGLSPKQFILSEKLDASRLLLSGDHTVRETALALGFYDEFHFSKAFKKHYGQSPSQYRDDIA